MYKSIEELPIYNFHKIMITSDLSYLLKEEIKEKKFVKIHDQLEKQWDNLYNEYLDHFGLSKNYKQIIDQETKICKLLIKRWLKNDRSMENIIEIEEIKLKELNQTKKKTSTFEEDIAIIEQHRKIGLDPHKTSVKMFYTYVKMIQDYGEKNK